MATQLKTRTVSQKLKVPTGRSVSRRDTARKKRMGFTDEPVTPSAVIDNNGPPPTTGGSPSPDPTTKPPG